MYHVREEHWQWPKLSSWGRARGFELTEELCMAENKLLLQRMEDELVGQVYELGYVNKKSQWRIKLFGKFSFELEENSYIASL